MSKIARLDFTTDAGEGARARLGLLVLESDHTMEQEFRILTGLEGVAVYHARLENDVVVTPETLGRMEAQLPIAAGLLPAHLGLNAIGYGCTSGATIIGEARVAEIIHEQHPNIPATNPITAAKAALEKLGVKKLALLTPYSPDVTEAMQANFNQAGIDVVMVGSFDESADNVVGKISPASIRDAAIEVGSHPDCDGVFISCTSLRAASIIDMVEQSLGKPVTASNHALAWHLLHLAGVDDKRECLGRLFR